MRLYYWPLSFLPIWLAPWLPVRAITGIPCWVDGDPRVLEATTPFNKARLARSVWTEVVIFEVADHDGPVFVGYLDYRGASVICRTPVTAKRFAALVGREGCRFYGFADARMSKPLKLTRVRISERQRLPADIPLI